VSLVPTSAITGEGIPDLLLLITQLTQSMMGDRLSYSHELQCTVLEVKMSDGIGYTIDVILVNGVLRVGDTIVLCGMQVCSHRGPAYQHSSYHHPCFDLHA
jgi:translation initiation factor 5B